MKIALRLATDTKPGRAARAALANSKGDVYYGLHMVPGVAEYRPPNAEMFRVFVAEDTIRAMGPTFEGRPLYVKHAEDDVPKDLDELKSEADGWVVESFFNEADGKHWAKFIVCSKAGRRAVAAGYRLSNCYTPNSFDKGGEWNGVSYDKEVKGGEYEHLALVPDPRYEESVVLTPDQFRAYNDQKKQDLVRLKNNKGEGKKMGLSLFKRTKIENAKDLESMVVQLPKSGREVSLTQLVNEADKAATTAGKPRLANAKDFVEIDGERVSIETLQNAYLEMNDDSKHEAETPEELANEDDEDQDDELENEDDDMDDLENEDDDEDLENADEGEEVAEDEEEKPAKKAKNKKPPMKKAKNKKPPMKKAKNASDDRSPEKKAADFEKAQRLKNAHKNGNVEDFAPARGSIMDPFAAVERGKARYGS